MTALVSYPMWPETVPVAASSTAYPTTAASAATPSLLVSPRATPMAKMRGRLPKMAPPDCAMTLETIAGSQVNSALPTPRRMPATGSTETGSMSDFPIFCSSAKAFLIPFMAVSPLVSWFP